MTRRIGSRRSSAELATLMVLAQVKADGIEHRLATDLRHIRALKTEIGTLGDRRGALIASRSVSDGAQDKAGTGDLALAAYCLAQADGLRLRQAALYRDLARAEAEVTLVRTEAARARGRAAALEKLACFRDRRHS
ncbi:MAG: hypothetical protein HLUCCO18_02895 [Rhodobacteraceae bacterium HLUCCO18]|nr:MAG: hypothetical protein HLUCCO18_02895 [Rhodobacteraceae bacterium HLUCCO18]